MTHVMKTRGCKMTRIYQRLVYQFIIILFPFFMNFSELMSSNIVQQIDPILFRDQLRYLMKYDPQIFNDFTQLSDEDKRKLIDQIMDFNLEILKEQKSLAKKQSIEENVGFIESFDDFDFYGNEAHIELGQQLIQKGELGCLLLAGGQGTRLKASGPKGCYPISVIQNKSLFQLIIEKVKAASELAGIPMNIAIMTSPENDKDTQQFFESNDFFGLKRDQIEFFVQKTLPLLNEEGLLFLETPSKVASGPDGNGYCISHFVKTGIWDKWNQKGVKYVNVIPVDNPLADPFDAEFLGFHVDRQADISFKCAEKKDPHEKVGLLVKIDGQSKVIEYSEMPDSEKELVRENKQLKHCCANLGLICFSMSFIKQMSDENRFLPLHKAWKTAKFLNEKGETETSKEPISWKFEAFIFDWLNYTSKVAALLYPREVCFAPLKNFSGPDSPETVKQALYLRDRQVLENITGVKAPEFLFELPMEFYYPSQDFINKWRGKLMSKNDESF